MDSTCQPGGSRHAEAGELTPKAIVAELDRYIIGQNAAKRAVAVALRNRWRRQQLDDDLRQEVAPKNILMIGPTGVGKTEIARRVAKIVDAPFVKVEATKFTEVGYVGRDVESIIRDLVQVSVSLLHREQLAAVQEQASSAADNRLADILVEQGTPEPISPRRRKQLQAAADQSEAAQVIDERPAPEPVVKRRIIRQRSRMIDLLQKDALEDETVELQFDNEYDAVITSNDLISGINPEELQETFSDFLEGLLPRTRTRRVSVREARRILTQQEANRLVDFDSVVTEAISRAEEHGIVFIDEIDKTINPNGEYGPDVSGEGVQRDLLPVVEGAMVMTRFGPVKTDHMLFIAAGSFQSVRPSDLIPELQGRFPIRVELSSLSEDDLFIILTEPENALTRQYMALLRAEDVTISFTEEALREIARIANDINARTEDIGARRLHTVVERVLEAVSFDAPDLHGQEVVIDGDYVRNTMDDVVADEDLSKFIL